MNLFFSHLLLNRDEVLDIRKCMSRSMLMLLRWLNVLATTEKSALRHNGEINCAKAGRAVQHAGGNADRVLTYYSSDGKPIKFSVFKGVVKP